MSKTRTVKGVGWDVSAIGNGKCCEFDCLLKYTGIKGAS